MIMGANIGTSITSTLVAFGNAGNGEEFKRSMACAVLGDAKNWLSVLVLLPIEAASGMLGHIVRGITKSIDTGNIHQDDFSVSGETINIKGFLRTYYLLSALNYEFCACSLLNIEKKVQVQQKLISFQH